MCVFRARVARMLLAVACDCARDVRVCVVRLRGVCARCVFACVVVRARGLGAHLVELKQRNFAGLALRDAIAGLGGVFVGSSSELGADPNLGFIAFKAFPAVIVGGLESPLGAVIAGISLGVLEVLTSAYVNESLGTFGTNFHAVLPYLVMILVLMVRPYGLFGFKKVERL